MYYECKVEGAVRVGPKLLFVKPLKEAVSDQLRADLEGNVDPILGRVLLIMNIEHIGDGIIISGDGAGYYKTIFTALCYIPEVQEIIEGEVREITKFGAFIDYGPFDGMVHISQTMDDYVSLDEKSISLTGKETKHVLKVGDYVHARVIAVSYRDPTEPKIGLTMRQPFLGKPDWLKEKDKKKKPAAKEEKQEKPKEKKEKK